MSWSRLSTEHGPGHDRQRAVADRRVHHPDHRVLGVELARHQLVGLGDRGDLRDARRRLERAPAAAPGACPARPRPRSRVRFVPGVLERRQALGEDQPLHAVDLGLGRPGRMTTNMRWSFLAVSLRWAEQKSRGPGPLLSRHDPPPPGSELRERSCRAGKAIDGAHRSRDGSARAVERQSRRPARATGRRSRGPCWYHPPARTERSHRGLVQRFAKPPSGVTCSEGSNPSLSATTSLRP